METLFFALVTKLWTEMGLDFEYYAKRHVFSTEQGKRSLRFLFNEKLKLIRFGVILNEVVPPEKVAETLIEINNFNNWWAGQEYCVLNDYFEGEEMVEYYVDYHYMEGEELSEERLKRMMEQAKNLDMFGDVTEWKSYL